MNNIIFSPAFRDYTSSFTEWEQQTFSSLSKPMQLAVLDHESSWSRKFKENSSMSLIELVELSNEVHPGIWIGAYEAACDSSLEGNKIDVVLNMAIELDYKIGLSDKQLIKIGIEDARLANKGVFLKAAEVIFQAKAAGKTVLVHCAAGISRSATAVIAYLMIHESMSWKDALAYVQISRSYVNPHPLLMRSLMRDIGPDFVP